MGSHVPSPRVRSLSSLGNILVLLMLIGLAFGHGCKDKSSSERQEEALNWVIANPDIDARGGDVDSRLGYGFRAMPGYAGQGGIIQVTSSAGDILMSDEPTALTPPTQVLSGAGGLVVYPGQSLLLSGSRVYSFLDVRDGGLIYLTGSANIAVTGDVRIAGVVCGSHEITVDGYDFTLWAGGTIYIPGGIDLTGQEVDDLLGGNGGNLWISTGSMGAVPPEYDITIAGVLDVSGGKTRGTNSLNSRPGAGGHIVISAAGSIGIRGTIRARGADAFTSISDLNRPDGGWIFINAEGDIEIYRARRVSARGGNGDTIAGDGGQIQLRALGGALEVLGTDLVADGGLAVFGGVPGAGGRVALVGTNDPTVALSDDLPDVSLTGNVSARGGSVYGKHGVAGIGGIVSVGVTEFMNVGSGSVMDVRGGDCEVDGVGGPGGALLMGAVDSDLFYVVGSVFAGVADITGGLSGVREMALPGSYCEDTGLDLVSLSQLIGSNPFPPTACNYADILATFNEVKRQIQPGPDVSESFYFYDLSPPFELDDDDTTIRPSRLDAQVDRGLIFHYWRVYIPDPGAVASVTVTATGSTVDLFVGPADVFGSPDFMDYPYYSATGEPSDSVTISAGIAGLVGPLGYLSVMIAPSVLGDRYKLEVTAE